MARLITGSVQLTEADYVGILKYWASQISKKELAQIISSYIQNNYGYTPSGVDCSDLNRVIVKFDQEFDPSVLSDKVPSGFKRTWKGLYSEVGGIIDHLRGKKRHFISFDDLLEELLKKKDYRGDKLFVKDGMELEMNVLRQRLAPSQIVRQAKIQGNLQGIKVDKKKAGLIF